MKRDETLASAMRSSIRVDRPEASVLETGETELLLNHLQSTPLRALPAVTFAPMVQALVNSGSAFDVASILFDQLTGPQIRSQHRSHIAIAQKSLDVCLYESFRHGKSLILDRADGALGSLEADLRSFTSRTGAGHSSFGNAEHRRLASFEVDVATAALLLNTEHQVQAIAVVDAYIDLLRSAGVWRVSSESLAAVLRRCTAPTRTFFNLSGLDELRSNARRVANEWLSNSPAMSTAEGVPRRSLWYRILLTSGDTDRQAEALRQMQRDTVTYDDPVLNDLLCNCVSWALETTLDPELTHLAESVFTNVEEPPRTHQYLAMAIRAGDRDRGQAWIDGQANRAPTASSRYLEARYHLAFGDPEQCLSAVSKPLSVYANVLEGFNLEETIPQRPELVTKLIDAGTPIIARLRNRLSTQSKPIGPIDPMVLYGAVRTAQEALFMRDIHHFVDLAGPSASSSDTTLVVAPNHTNFLTQLPIVAIERARQEGTEVVSMVNGLYPASPNLSAAAKAIEDAIMPGFYFYRGNPSSELSTEWNIDLENEMLEYRGINYFHCVHNSLGIHFRRFSIDFDNEVEHIQLHRNLILIQGVQQAFQNFLDEMSPDRRYLFVVLGIQAGLGSVLRSLISACGRENVRVIHACNGFETFDPEFEIDPASGNSRASYHSVADLTDLPNTPLGFRPTPADCTELILGSEAQYRELNPSVDAYLEKVDGRAKNAALRARPAHRSRRRILVIGTILPDLSIPHDTGLAHHNILDWVRHTVDVAERENLELIVKPHPAEINQKMGFYVSESFADLFPSSENVTVLPYDADFHDAVFDADLVVIWSGTSVVELTLMGRPYVACSRFAREEYPLGDPPFSTRDGYEELLCGELAPQVSEGGRLQAIDIIHRVTTSPIRERSELPVRQLLNGHVWPPRFDVDAAMEELSSEASMQLAERLRGQ